MQPDFPNFLLEVLSEISGWVALKTLSRPKQTPLNANSSLQRASLLPRASPQEPFSAALMVLMWREGTPRTKTQSTHIVHSLTPSSIPNPRLHSFQLPSSESPLRLTLACERFLQAGPHTHDAWLLPVPGPLQLPPHPTPGSFQVVDFWKAQLGRNPHQISLRTNQITRSG